MRAKDVLGADGEQWAAEYLTESGMVVLDRNWRCRDGEIDIVAADRDVLVVCEVKTRSGPSFGLPLEAVGAAKVARLHRLGHRYRVAKRAWAPVRVDLIGILAAQGRPVDLEHLRGVG